MGVYEEQIVPIKISRLAEYVSQRKRISLEEALAYIYINPMYEELYDEGAKWWYLSTEALRSASHSRNRICDRRNRPIHTTKKEKVITVLMKIGSTLWLIVGKA